MCKGQVDCLWKQICVCAISQSKKHSIVVYPATSLPTANDPFMSHHQDPFVRHHHPHEWILPSFFPNLSLARTHTVLNNANRYLLVCRKNTHTHTHTHTHIPDCLSCTSSHTVETDLFAEMDGLRKSISRSRNHSTGIHIQYV